MSTPEDETAEQVGGRAAIQCPYQEIISLFHEICKSYPKLRAISGNRRKAVSARWREYPKLETFRELFTKAERSSFMKGKNNRDWTADFDWMMKASNMAKILEGKYDDKNEQPRTSNNGAMATLQRLYEEASDE